MISKSIDFIVFGCIFIACCAVGMAIETNMLLHLPLNPIGFYAFIFGATLSQYNLHYLVKSNAIVDSKRFHWSIKHKLTHRYLFLFGCILMGTSIFSLHIKHFLVLVCMAMISMLYSLPFLPFKNKKRIKDYGLLKIITLALLWTVVTVWFPLVESSFKFVSFQFIFIRRFLFIFILCLIFDVRDIEVDSRTGIKTVPVLIGQTASVWIAHLLLLLFVVISWIEYSLTNDLSQFVAMLVSAFSTFLVIVSLNFKRNDFYYLVGIDGMMLLQFVFVILAQNYLH